MMLFFFFHIYASFSLILVMVASMSDRWFFSFWQIRLFNGSTKWRCMQNDYISFTAQRRSVKRIPATMARSNLFLIFVTTIFGKIRSCAKHKAMDCVSFHESIKQKYGWKKAITGKTIHPMRHFVISWEHSYSHTHRYLHTHWAHYSC